MPAITRLGDKTTGHGCFPPTSMITTPVAKTYFNGKLAGVVNSNCKWAAHVCGITTHNSDQRYPTSGASKTYIEGSLVARIADPIACGDTIAQGSSNSFVE
jgi:uncharacterized Zn-binding protein involved in type VI secretion